ncbi:MAG: DUF1015 domain-containing protein [Endomicrobium sp.]|nr:DUF1015 domain-containing protein [Endomicrobium sp.]
MAEIKSFRTIMYSREVITDFISPPYDVISPDEKTRLQKLSLFNIVNIELSDYRDGKNKHKNAAGLLQSLEDDGIFEREEKPALCFYEQIFEDHGIKMTRRGFCFFEIGRSSFRVNCER